MHRAFVGIGSNLGDRAANVERALESLEAAGNVARVSSLYRTVPWGNVGQPWFLNAVALLETELSPHELLAVLQAAETRLGRERGKRWGPRSIDLDLLLYDEVEIDDARLRVPHRHLCDRAFVLVPLAEIDARFTALRDALDASELAGVAPFERESAPPMSELEVDPITARVRALASFLAESDAVRVRVVRGDEDVEISVRPRERVRAEREADSAAPATPAQRVDAIKSDLVGIFHLGRPAPTEGEVVDGDRELGYVEALGIRTPVHSMGAGRIVRVAAEDGSPVEYGQSLFLMARGA